MFMPPQFPAHSPCVVLHYTYAVLAPFADETSDKIMLLYATCAVVAHTFCIFLAGAHAHILHNAVFPSYYYRLLRQKAAKYHIRTDYILTIAAW